MFDLSSAGKLFLGAGCLFVVIGLIFLCGSKIPWLGRLPGDIYIQKKGFLFYFPIATSILISIVLSIVMFFLRKK